MAKYNPIQKVMAEISSIQKILFVLFGFRAHLALHLERSPSSHSYGYDSAGDRPSYFASSTLNPESFVQYTG